MAAADEQQLILHAKAGDRSAFRVLVERYMKHAYNVAYNFVNDHDDAEDVAQEAFVRVYQSLHSFRGEAEFGTWLYRIVANLSFNRLRQRKSVQKREVALNDQTLHQFATEAVDCPPHDVHAYIERVLHELPTLQRAVVILRHLNGMSTRQVSEILQCTEGTVKTHLHRGLRKMRSKMEFLKDELV